MTTRSSATYGSNAWILTLFSVASFPLLLFSQVRLMIQYHWFWIYSPFVLLAALFLALPLLTDGLSRKFDFGEHRRLVDSWRPDVYPSVDVFLPVAGEPVEVLRNTWTYVAAMSEHYPGVVTPYVLDDSHSPELKQMAREFGFAYATRPNRGWFKKSGNLYFGFQVSYGDYILLLDADFAPRADLLDEALPYMDAYPDTGIVQTPQFFRIADDQTWVERGAGAVQELFYRSIQTARARKGGSICVGPARCTGGRRLQDNLGMTLAEHSEDVLTGFDLNAKGWRLRYIPVALSTGNCPDNVLAFLNQQYRWCSGTVGPAVRQAVLGRQAAAVHPDVLHLRAGLLHLHRAVHLPGPRADHRHPRVRAERAAVQEHDLHDPGAAVLGGDHPVLASRAVPAGGVGGAGDLRVGAPVRVLGRGPGQAARLEALRRRHEEAGRPAPVLGLLHRLDRGQLAGMDRPGVLAHDHHEPCTTSSSCSA